MQLLSSQRHHLAEPFKVYDPLVYIDIVENQYHDFDMFINDVDMVVIMVGHTEIKEKGKAITGKIVLDTRNVCRDLKFIIFD